VRTLGLILATAGALALGSQGISGAGLGSTDGAPAERAEKAPIPPVAGGIALTGGLLLLVTGTRRYSPGGLHSFLKSSFLMP
jgi:hypothetical protein